MTVGRIPSVEGGIQPTIVDAKGDLIAAVAADSLNRLAVGSNDQVLVADSAASTGLAWKSYGAQVVAGKNFVINGGFDIWQRGTSVSVAASVSNTYTADRWSMGTGTSQTCTVSRQATGDTTNLPFIQYCARVQRNSGQTGTATIPFTQAMETINSIPFMGKTITFSFYARAGANYSAASNALGVQLYTGTGTDQNLWSYTGTIAVLNTSATLTTTWQRFTYTGTLSSSGNEIGFQFNHTPTGTAGTNDYYEITGVQLELGSVATPFSRNSATIQGELAACQRYYWRTGLGNIYSSYGTGTSISGNTTTIIVNCPVSMRIAPTVLDGTGTASNYAIYDGVTITACTSLSLDRPVLTVFSLQVTVASGLTTYRPVLLINNNNSTAFLGFSAEL